MENQMANDAETVPMQGMDDSHAMVLDSLENYGKASNEL